MNFFSGASLCSVSEPFQPTNLDRVLRSSVKLPRRTVPYSYNILTRIISRDHTKFPSTHIKSSSGVLPVVLTWSLFMSVWTDKFSLNMYVYQLRKYTQNVTVLVGFFCFFLCRFLEMSQHKINLNFPENGRTNGKSVLGLKFMFPVFSPTVFTKVFSNP
jgi:hypothetical protein